jgi:hypothetical protein
MTIIIVCIFSYSPCVGHVRRYCDRGKSYLDILTDFQVFSTPEYGMLPVRLSVRMCTLLDAGRFRGFNLYSEFIISCIMGPCPMNMNILAPKIGVFRMGPKKQSYDFLGNFYDNFD